MVDLRIRWLGVAAIRFFQRLALADRIESVDSPAITPGSLIHLVAGSLEDL